MTTKEKIFSSALELFAEQGVDKTSTADIAKHAGVASGTVFVHFESKEQLIQELYLNLKEGIMSQLSQVLQNTSKNESVEQVCKTLFAHVIRYLLAEPKQFAFVQQVEHNPAYSICTDDAKDDIGKFFFQAMNRGELKKIDIELLQKIIWGLIEAIASYYQKNNIKQVQPEHINIIYSAIEQTQ
mgnify:CR=1 FL=1